jgi:hypothetical protein
MRRILENRLSGVKTNQNSWQTFYGTALNPDVSMNRVAEISNTYFDFGSPPQTKTQASETTVTQTQDTSYLNP